KGLSCASRARAAARASSFSTGRSDALVKSLRWSEPSRSRRRSSRTQDMPDKYDSRKTSRGSIGAVAPRAIHHLGVAVDDLDEAPRQGLFGLEVAFVHPDAVHGVLSEVVAHG